MSTIINQLPFAGLISWLINLVRNTSNLLRTSSTPYHLATSCPPDNGGDAPCVCTYPTGLSSTYTVSGFGSLVPCGGCDSSSDPPWPGTMYHVTTGCIWWATDATFDPFSINGHILDISYTQLRLNGTASPCRWELAICCGSVLFPTKIMWVGYKTAGTTPVGIYDFASSDCGNTTPTMSVA
jgi:hypothetical protein